MLKSLLSVGVLAIEAGQPVQAQQLFKAVGRARPESEAPLVCMAVALIDAGELDTAIELLQAGALVVNPHSQLAKTFLGMALKFKGMRYQSQDLLEEVLREGADPHAVRIAQDLLAMAA